MTVDDLPIAIDPDRIEEFCRQRGNRRLSLFGSVLREDFVPGASDVDVFAELDAPLKLQVRRYLSAILNPSPEK